jgi:hypothetical protein
MIHSPASGLRGAGLRVGELLDLELGSIGPAAT